MRKLFISLLLAGLLTLATAVPAFAHIPPEGPQQECVIDGVDHDPEETVKGAMDNDCGDATGG